MAAGDTDPSDAFDPATQWAGFAVDTFDGLGAHTVDGGGPVDAPAMLTCGGAAGHRRRHGREPRGDRHRPRRHDRRPGGDRGQPEPGRRLDHPYRVHPGRRRWAAPPAPRSASSADLAAGAYTVTLTATDAGGGTASCALAVQVTRELTVGEVQGPTTDAESGPTDRSPLAPASGNGTSSTLYDVRGVITQLTLARTSAGADQHGFFLQSRVGDDRRRPDSAPTASSCSWARSPR